MKIKQLLSVALGFGTIGLLSSALAKLQGIVYPASLSALGHPALSNDEVIQLIIKLACQAASCVFGGMVTAWAGGNFKARIAVSLGIVGVIGWLWFNTIYPIWFWLLLIIFTTPAILLGGKVARAK